MSSFKLSVTCATTSLAALAILGVGLHANEPLWTDAQRMANSAIVYVGQVSSIERVSSINDQEDLFQAKTVVITIDKGLDATTRELTVFLVRPKNGDAQKRSPAYVDLKPDQKARFFVRRQELGGKRRLVLEMGSDVRETAELSPIHSSIFSNEKDPKMIAAAKTQGGISAANDIQAGVLRILYFGVPWSNGKPLVDDETGYRVQVVTGCIVSRIFVEEVGAYNAAMRAHHRKLNPQAPGEN